MKKLKGLRVINVTPSNRGCEDGGKNIVGTLTQPSVFSSHKMPKDQFFITWDTGLTYNYDNKKSFLVVDNGPTDIKHDGVTCDVCLQEPIIGMRFKCMTCEDYDLCSRCYMADKHIEHSFCRFSTPLSEGVKLGPRKDCTKTPIQGIFEKAQVVRGIDWKFRKQDGGANKTGRVKKYSEKEFHGIVKVKWDVANTNIYRVGPGGKVDLACVQPAHGGDYYFDHLPRLSDYELENSYLKFSYKDKVKIKKEKLHKFEKEGGKYKKIFTGIGTVLHRVDNKIMVAFNKQLSVLVEPSDLELAPLAKVGELVQITDNHDLFESNQEGHGGYLPVMKKILGKKGRITQVHITGDYRIRVPGSPPWTINPSSVCPIIRGDVDGNHSADDDDDDDDSSDNDNNSGNDSDILPSGLKELLDSDDSDFESLSKMHQDFKRLFKSRKSDSGDDSSDDSGSDSDSGKSLLQYCAKGDLIKVDALLEKNKSLASKPIKGKSVLHVAVNENNLELAKLLVEKHNADVNIADDDGDTPLHLAAMKQKSIEIFLYLLEKKADFNKANKKKMSVLHMACKAKNLMVVENLLTFSELDINVRDATGDTPLFDALREDDEHVVDLLLNHPKTDPNFKNYKSFNILHHCSFHNRLEYMAQILSKFPELLNSKCDKDFTALHIASANGYHKIVTFLINQDGIDLNPRNAKKETPLMIAAEARQHAVIEILLNKNGVDINAQNENNENSLHLQFEKESLLRSFMHKSKIEDAPEIEKLSKNLPTEIQEKGALSCYMALKGVKVDVRNTENKTPLDMAPKGIVEHIKEYADRYEKSQLTCLMCQEKAKKFFRFEPCGDGNICKDCGDRMKICFVCRKPIKDKILY